LSNKQQVTEEKGAGAPAYLVTFSALVTLLMLFFVLLLTLAKVQDEGILGNGRYAETQESFLRSIRTFGLGELSSGKITPDFGHIKIKYFIKKPDENFQGRTVDAEEEELRRVFKDIRRSAKTMPSQIVAQKTNFSVTNITFSPGEALLNEPAKKFLTQFAAGLQQDADSKKIKPRLFVGGRPRRPLGCS